MASKCASVVAILCLIIAIWLGMVHQYVGDFRHHESLPWWPKYVTWSGYYALNIPLRVKHYIFDGLFVDNNPRNVSIELRALEDMFSLVKPDSKWRGPSDEATFLRIYNHVCNVLSYLVPIPVTTAIDSQLLLAQQFIVQLRDTLQSKYNLSIPNQAHPALSPRMFIPRTVELLWFVGNSSIDNSSNARTIVYFHGGGYVLCGQSHFGFVSHLSIATNTRVLFVMYSKPPISTIPKQVSEIMTVYLYLIEAMRIPPQHLIIGGDSAGGGLAVLLLQKLSMLGLNEIYPNGAFLLSPWVDLTMSSISWSVNDEQDVVLDYGFVERCGIMAVGYDKNKLNCPLHSALHNEHGLQKLPNVYVLVSRHEALFNDSQHLVQKLEAECESNCNIQYEIEENRPHIGPIFLGLFPESLTSFHKLVRAIRAWID